MTEELTIADYEEVLADKRRMTRQLDVALHGERGAAAQASLCDLIEPAKRIRSALLAARTVVEAYLIQNGGSKVKEETTKAVVAKIDFALGEIPFRSSTVAADLSGSDIYEEVLQFRRFFNSAVERYVDADLKRPSILWMDEDTWVRFRREMLYRRDYSYDLNPANPDLWYDLAIRPKALLAAFKPYEMSGSPLGTMTVPRQPFLLSIEYVIKDRTKYFDHPDTDEAWL